MIVGPLAVLIALGLLVWAIFNPITASWTFIALFIFVFEGYTLLLFRTDSRTPIEPHVPPYSFSDAEVKVVKRYYFFFRSPGLAREWSSTLSMIGLSTFVWVPWLLYQSLYIQAAIIGVNYFLAGPMSMRLNPLIFLQRGTASGTNVVAGIELEAVRSVIEKIQSVRSAA